jgi:hypothetical protein
MAALLGALGCDGAAGQPDAGTSGTDGAAADVRTGNDPIIDYVQALVAAPDKVDFGCVEPGKSFAFPVRIENRSEGRNGPLSVTLTAPHTPEANLTILTDGCDGEYLEAWQSCLVTLFLMTSVATRADGGLRVTAPAEHYPLSVPIRAQSSPMFSKLSEPQTVVDFGEVSTRATRSIEVVMTNVSDAQVSPPYAEFTSGYSIFSVGLDSCAGQTIPPLGTCSVTAYFAPPAAGLYEDVLAVGADDACSPIPRIKVKGTGVVIPAP